MSEKNTLTTTAAGIPVGDNQNGLTAGPRDPLLVQDWPLFKSMPTSTGSASPSASSTPKGPAPTAR